MTQRFVVVGAGGFALEVADLLMVLGHQVVAYFDEAGAARQPLAVPAPVTDVWPREGVDAAAIAVGDCAARARLYGLSAERYAVPTLVHPSASVSPSASLGNGTLVMQNVVVNAMSHIGADTLVNVGCCVAHGCRVGAHSHLGPSTNVGGGSDIGERVFCGTGATVLPGMRIGEGATLGAGAVAVHDVPPGQTWVGVPARHLPTATAGSDESL